MRVGLTLNTQRSSIGFTGHTETATYGVYVRKEGCIYTCGQDIRDENAKATSAWYPGQRTTAGGSGKPIITTTAYLVDSLGTVATANATSCCGTAAVGGYDAGATCVRVRSYE